MVGTGNAPAKDALERERFVFVETSSWIIWTITDLLLQFLSGTQKRFFINFVLKALSDIEQRKGRIIGRLHTSKTIRCQISWAA